nr:tripartite tricarboxylate transporter TctB family protein [Alteribacter salitolerans]
MVAVVFIVIGAVFFYQTLSFPEGAQMYPRFIIGIMVGLALLLLIQTFIKKPDTSYKKLFGHIHWKRFIGVLVFSFLYLILINQIGFFVTTVVYLVGTMVFLRATVKTIAIAVPSFVLVLYLIFSEFLNVPLPSGILV